MMQWRDGHPPNAELSRLPLSTRDHRPLQLALLSLQPELSRRPRDDAGARRRGFTRGHSTLVFEVRNRVCEASLSSTWPSWGYLVSRRSLLQDQRPVGYLWRAVDQSGEVLDVLVQKRRDTKARSGSFESCSRAC